MIRVSAEREGDVMSRDVFYVRGKGEILVKDNQYYII